MSNARQRQQSGSPMLVEEQKDGSSSLKFYSEKLSARIDNLTNLYVQKKLRWGSEDSEACIVYLASLLTERDISADILYRDATEVFRTNLDLEKGEITSLAGWSVSPFLSFRIMIHFKTLLRTAPGSEEHRVLKNFILDELITLHCDRLITKSEIYRQNFPDDYKDLAQEIAEYIFNLPDDASFILTTGDAAHALYIYFHKINSEEVHVQVINGTNTNSRYPDNHPYFPRKLLHPQIENSNAAEARIIGKATLQNKDRFVTYISHVITCFNQDSYRLSNSAIYDFEANLERPPETFALIEKQPGANCIVHNHTETLKIKFRKNPELLKKLLAEERYFIDRIKFLHLMNFRKFKVCHAAHLDLDPRAELLNLILEKHGFYRDYIVLDTKRLVLLYQFLSTDQPNFTPGKLSSIIVEAGKFIQKLPSISFSFEEINDEEFIAFLKIIKNLKALKDVFLRDHALTKRGLDHLLHAMQDNPQIEFFTTRKTYKAANNPQALFQPKASGVKRTMEPLERKDEVSKKNKQEPL